MRLRTLELSLGLLLLLGPLGYALTLESEVVEVEVERIVEVERVEVVQVAAPAPAPVPVPVVEVEPSVPAPAPVEAPAPAPVEPTPDLEGRLQLAPVTAAGLVLSLEAERAWGTGRLREHAGPGEYRAAKRADVAELPAELLAHRGRTFDVYGSGGKLCTARLGELSVVAQHDGPSLFEVFHGSLDAVDYEDGEEHPADVFEREPHTPRQIHGAVWRSDDASRWLVAELVSDTPCEGGLWARDFELPPPRLLHVGPSPIVEQRLAAHEASTALADAKQEYATWLEEHPDDREGMSTWAEIEREHPATVEAWLDDAGTPRIVELSVGTSSDFGACGDDPVTEITAVDEVVGGAFAATDRATGFIAAFDADLDGHFELLYDGHVHSETPELSQEWSVYEEWYCPC